MKCKKMKKLWMYVLTCVMLMGFLKITANADTVSDDIVILYTNDVHTYIDGPLSYDMIAAVKEELGKTYENVLLVDAGDHVQGTAYGSMDKGGTIIKLMNASGYDLATLGNHEFDYGMFGCMQVIDWAEFPYVSCNFYHEENGVRKDNVLESYRIFDCGDEKIAFVGITTPESFTKSTPAYFQNEKGDYIYGIAGGDKGEDLHIDVQEAIDAAKADGATKVIALGHLGIDPSSEPWTSERTIANVSGLDAFIDGHSHSIVESSEIADKDGNTVLLTQTGQYFDRIGVMVIDGETGDITTDFIETEEILDKDGETVLGYNVVSEWYPGKEIISDTDVKAIKDEWMTKIDEELGKVIGSATVVLDNYDKEGNRLVRSQGTNSGDFSADALYYLFDSMEMDVDVAVMNGGGIRNNAVTGDISYKVCKEIHTFGNVACLQTVTGQQLLDALEWGARFVGEAENGSLLHVSGLTYKVDISTPNTTQQDDKEVWTGGPSGEYRVHDVKVYNKDTKTWDDLNLEAEYNLAGYNYNLRDLCGGYSMFEGAVNVLDYVMEDYLVLSNYVQAFDNAEVGATNSPLAAKYEGFAVDYSAVDGSGRIEIVTEREVEEVITEPEVAETEEAQEETIAVEETVVEKGGTSPIWYVVIIVLIGVAAAVIIWKKMARNE